MENEDDNNTKKKNIAMGLWDSIKGGFNFGTLLTVLLVCTGLYFGLRTEAGQALAGKIVDFFDGDKTDNGKDKVKQWMDKITAGIASILPQGAADKLAGNALGDMLGNLSAADAKTLMLDQKLPQGVVDVLTANDATWKGFVATVQNAQPNKKLNKPEQLLNEHSLFALITEQKDLTKKLLGSIKAGGADGDDKTKTALFESLRKIINDDARLGTLLSDTHRRSTIEMLLSVSGDIGMSAEQIEAQLKKIMDKGGLPAVKDLLNRLCVPNPPAATEVLGSVISDPNAAPEVKQAMLDLAREEAVKQLGAKNAPAFDALTKVIGANGLQTVIATATAQYDADPNVNAIASARATSALIMKDLPTLQAFKKFADTADLNSMQPDMKKMLAGPLTELRSLNPATIDVFPALIHRGVQPQDVAAVFTPPQGTGGGLNYIIDQLRSNERTNPIARPDGSVEMVNNRQLLTIAHPNNVSRMIWGALPTATPAQVTEKSIVTRLTTPGNLQAIVKAFDRIDARTQAYIAANPKQPQVPVANADAVLKAVLGLASGTDGKVDMSALKKLDPNMVATFFKDPEYSAAVETLIREMNINGSDAPARVFAALKAHWGTVTEDKSRKDLSARDGFGFAEILSDAKAITYMLDEMGDGAAKPEKISTLEVIVGRFNSDLNPFSTTIPAKLDENLDHVVEFNNSMVDIANGTHVTPKATSKPASHPVQHSLIAVASTGGQTRAK